MPTTTPRIDDVAAVDIGFRFDPVEGGVLTRRILPWPTPGLADDGTVRDLDSEASIILVPPAEAARVKEVAVDGERIWPEDGDDKGGDTLARIDEAMDKIEELADGLDDDEGEEESYWPAPTPRRAPSATASRPAAPIRREEDADEENAVLQSRLDQILSTGRPPAEPADDGDRALDARLRGILTSNRPLANFDGDDVADDGDRDRQPD